MADHKHELSWMNDFTKGLMKFLFYVLYNLHYILAAAVAVAAWIYLRGGAWPSWLKNFMRR